MAIFGLALHYASRAWFGNESIVNTLFWVVSAIGFVSLVLLSVFWLCPYCKKSFFTGNIVTNPFASKCVHCKKGSSHENP